MCPLFCDWKRSRCVEDPQSAAIVPSKYTSFVTPCVAGTATFRTSAGQAQTLADGILQGTPTTTFCAELDSFGSQNGIGIGIGIGIGNRNLDADAKTSIACVGSSADLCIASVQHQDCSRFCDGAVLVRTEVPVSNELFCRVKSPLREDTAVQQGERKICICARRPNTLFSV